LNEVELPVGRERGMMTTKIEDLSNEQLDVLCAEKVMEWEFEEDTGRYVSKGPQESIVWVAPSPYGRSSGWWQPTTNIAQAFEVDKPEWEWKQNEHAAWSPNATLSIQIWDTTRKWPESDPNQPAAWVNVPLDPNNKPAAYCRGRCICALKACGVTEVE